MMWKYLKQVKRNIRMSLRNTKQKGAPSRTGISLSMKYPWVGPPDPVSNLRPTVFPEWLNFTEAEKEYHKQNKEIQEWNQKYWQSHNVEFQQSRESFMQQHRKENKLEENAVLTAEEMAHFYRMFLDNNHEKHVNYNREWYRKNFYLLRLAARANVSRAIHFVLSKGISHKS